MRTIRFWETDEEYKNGIHYNLILSANNGTAEASIIDGKGQIESQYYSEPYTNEKAGLWNVARGIHQKMEDIPKYDTLRKRMYTLANADYDSSKEKDTLDQEVDDFLSYWSGIRTELAGYMNELQAVKHDDMGQGLLF